MDLVDRGDWIVPAWPLGGRGPATFWVVAGLVPLVGLGVVCNGNVRRVGRDENFACISLALIGILWAFLAFR